MDRKTIRKRSAGRLRPTPRAVLGAGLVVALLAGAVVAAEAGAGSLVENGPDGTSVEESAPRSILEAAAHPRDDADPAETDPDEPQDAPPAVPDGALPAASNGALPDAAALQAAITAIDTDAVEGHQVATVRDAETGQVLVDRGATEPVIPASTMKVVTVAAALDTFGADHTFTTATVLDAQGRLVLVGGGDPYLRTQTSAQAPSSSLQDLARDTARGLAARGVTEVELVGDASLFAGDGWHPSWPDSYRVQVTPVSALTVDQGRTAGVSPGPRVSEPAADSVASFAAALGEAGVSVRTGGVLAPDQSPGAQRSPDQHAIPAASAAAWPEAVDPVATVESAPLAAIAEEVLVYSDNDAAEILAHHVGVATGHGGTFDGAGAGITEVLQDRGVDTTGFVLHDGSGLSRDNRLTTAALADILTWGIAEEAHRPLLTGLPVGSVSGTLTDRFDAEGTAPGRGTVRAKTGTLSGTSGLAGYAVTASGRQVTYGLVVNDAADDAEARVWLDRASAAIVAAE